MAKFMGKTIIASIDTGLSKVTLKKREFLIAAKNLHLIYLNCNLSLDNALEQLKKLLSSYVITTYLLVREIDDKGQPNLHVYLKTLKKCNITSSNFLNLKNSENKIYVGKYESAKKKNLLIQTMLKSIREKGDPNALCSEDLFNIVNALANYKTLEETLIELAEQGKIEEGMLLLKKEDPVKFLWQSSKYEKRMIEIFERTKKKIDINKK